MDTEDQILKGKKLITNTKKAKIKNLEQLLDFQKYNIKEKKKKKKKTDKVTKIILKYIYLKFAFKKQGLFCKVIVGYKNEN